MTSIALEACRPGWAVAAIAQTQTVGANIRALVAGLEAEVPNAMESSAPPSTLAANGHVELQAVLLNDDWADDASTWPPPCR